MENEYRERTPDDGNADNPRSGRRSRNSERDIARETLENLQGNVYRERTDESVVGSRFTANNAGNDPKTGTGRAGADRNPRPDQPKTSRASADRNPRPNDQPKTNDTVGADRNPRQKKTPRPPKRPNIIVQVLNGDILTRDFVLNNLTYIFFFLFLLLLVVSKGYYGKQLTKDIDTLQTEVNASTAEYIENKAKLEELTSRYRLVEMLERRGLKESLKPAKVIRIKRPEK
jgi:cell division protein FtsL